MPKGNALGFARATWQRIAQGKDDLLGSLCTQAGNLGEEVDIALVQGIDEVLDPYSGISGEASFPTSWNSA